MSIELLLRVAAALGGAYLAALWITLVAWAYRDIRSRTKDPFTQFLALALVVLFFPLMNLPGLLLYYLLRPRQTLAETEQRELEEEALVRELEEVEACPQCQRRMAPDFALCPYCRTQLKRICPNCERLLRLHWTVCPYCGS